MKNNDKSEKIPWLEIVITLVSILTLTWLTNGCASIPKNKARHLNISGAYCSQLGTFAIGAIEVQSAPDSIESVMIRYNDDTAWFSNKTKHSISILLTGTNSVSSADVIVQSICRAFVDTARAEDDIQASKNSP